MKSATEFALESHANLIILNSIETFANSMFYTVILQFQPLEALPTLKVTFKW